MPRTGRPAARTVDSVRRAIAALDALAEAGGEASTTEIYTSLFVGSVRCV